MDFHEDVPSLLREEAELSEENDDIDEDVERLGQDDVDYLDIESQLEQFRQQWKDEIKGSNSNQNENAVRTDNDKEAAALFLMGSKLEQEGALYEAVNFYRRAMQLVPDIEMKIQYPVRSPRERQESESSVDSFDGEDGELALVTKFHNLQVEEKKLCYPNYIQRACHISALPVEVLIYIFKWVVSMQLDMRSLESLALVCRGFYVCARDEELWRLTCLRLWGSSTGKVKKYITWRNMYIQRPHVQFVGCYISRMSYIRQGEKSLDGFYSPWHQIEYYRYIRFFSEGKMLMMTSPEDPLTTLPLMKSLHAKTPGMMKGVFKLSGNRVTGVLNRIPMSDTTINYKYKRNKNQKISNEIQQTFHVELEIQSLGRKNGRRLSWVHYSVRTINKSTGEDTESEFELKNQSYPPLVFSRVKSYSNNTTSPLLL